MEKEHFVPALELLRQPVLPLVSMVQFLFFTGPFQRITEVVAELPEPIETDYTRYEHPAAVLSPYLALLSGLEKVKQGQPPPAAVVSEDGTPVDSMTAASSLVRQAVLERELEQVNSLFCKPCRCTLCCIGPDRSMQQEFFEIPLHERETALFAATRHDSPASRRHTSADTEILFCDGRPFYSRPDPGIFHWRNGWSLILPRESVCPNLDPADGRCRVYARRPGVCRKPQIFGYILEELEDEDGTAGRYRLRDTLLAVRDCPYVQTCREEIGDYAAACELKLVLRQNKQ